MAQVRCDSLLPSQGRRRRPNDHPPAGGICLLRLPGPLPLVRGGGVSWSALGGKCRTGKFIVLPDQLGQLDSREVHVFPHVVPETVAAFH